MKMKLTVDETEVVLGAAFQQSLVECIPDSPAYEILFSALAKADNAEIRSGVADKENITDETAKVLLNDTDPRVLDRILNNGIAKSIVTTDHLKNIMRIGGNDVIKTIISNISEYDEADMEEVVNLILKMNSPGLNLALAENYQTPKRILKKLLKSDDPDIQNAARRSLE